MKYAKTVEAYLESKEEWQEALLLLRELMLATKMEECVKWGIPVYTIKGKNVVGIAAFKSYVGLWFYQGALLENKEQKLINAQEGITKALRQWRFQSAKEIEGNKEIIFSYLKEAIQNQEAGKTIQPSKKKPLIIPAQLQGALDTNPALKEAFEAFNLTDQRAFSDYIDQAKQAATKEKRLQKVVEMILRREGMMDKYKKRK